MWRLWVWTHQPGSFFSAEKIGIKCPHCDQSLVLIKRWAILVGWLALVAGCALSTIVVFALLSRKLSEAQVILAALAAFTPFLAAYMWLSPQCLRLRPTTEADSVSFSDFYQKSISVRKLPSNYRLERP